MITQTLDLEGGEKSACVRVYANNFPLIDPRRREIWQAQLLVLSGGPWFGIGDSPTGATMNALRRRLSLGGPVPVPPTEEEVPQP